MLESPIRKPEVTQVQAIVLNLRIENEDTRALGVHRHVAEVQFVLEAFIRVQVNLPNGWHDRYLHFRAAQTQALRREQRSGTDASTSIDAAATLAVSSTLSSQPSPAGPSASPPPLQLLPPPQPIPTSSSSGQTTSGWNFTTNRRRILPEGPGSSTDTGPSSAAGLPAAAAGPVEAIDGGLGGDVEQALVLSRPCCGDGALGSWREDGDLLLGAEFCDSLCVVVAKDLASNHVTGEVHPHTDDAPGILTRDMDGLVESKSFNRSASSQSRYSTPKIESVHVRSAALLEPLDKDPPMVTSAAVADEVKALSEVDSDEDDDDNDGDAPAGWFAPFDGPHASCEDPGQVIRTFLWTTSASGDALDARRARVDAAMRLSSAGSVWFTSKPLQAAASKGLFQLFFIGLAGFFFYRGIMLSTSLPQAGPFRASRLRLVVLEVRGGGRPIGQPVLDGIGILSRGCVLAGANISTLNTSTQAMYGVSSAMGQAVFEVDMGNSSDHGFMDLSGDGYYLETSDSSPELDPSRWALYARVSEGDGGDNWKMVGASGSLLWFGGENRFFPDLSFSMPMQRNAKVKFDLRPTWPSIIGSFTATFEWTICLVASVVAGRIGRAHWVGPMVAFFAGLDVAAQLAAFFGSLVIGDLRRAAQFLLYAFTPAVLAGGVLWSEGRFLAVLVAYGASHALAAGLVHLYLYRTPWMVLLRELATSETSATLAFAILVLAMRRRIVLRALSLVRQDIEKYNDLWTAVSGTEAARDQLQAMQREVGRLVPRGSLRRSNGAIFGRPRHLDRPLTRRGMSLTASFASWAVNVARLSRPIRSLDQLYLQALMLHPILLRRVQGWARACGGLFPLKRRNCEFENKEIGSPRITYARLTDEGYLESDFKFARIKSVERAVEKIERTYGQDASLLVDICRQSIVFDSIPDLTACLRSIACDSQVLMLAKVVLHRVKNRLRLDYDATSSAGYRDVALNLSLTNSETRGLGLNGHVCEVQLLLRDFAELKSDEGHKRYVSFRQMRGE